MGELCWGFLGKELGKEFQLQLVLESSGQQICSPETFKLVNHILFWCIVQISLSIDYITFTDFLTDFIVYT